MTREHKREAHAAFLKAGGTLVWSLRLEGVDVGLLEVWLVKGELRLLQSLPDREAGIEIWQPIKAGSLEELLRKAIP